MRSHQTIPSSHLTALKRLISYVNVWNIFQWKQPSYVLTLYSESTLKTGLMALLVCPEMRNLVHPLPGFQLRYITTHPHARIQKNRASDAGYDLWLVEKVREDEK